MSLLVKFLFLSSLLIYLLIHLVCDLVANMDQDKLPFVPSFQQFRLGCVSCFMQLFTLQVGVSALINVIEVYDSFTMATLLGIW